LPPCARRPGQALQWQRLPWFVHGWGWVAV
jgi:hypothetical protein